ncbi:MAG: TIGR01459 family HAD-type hydrolase [Burkholderiaceae bacterium]|nr:TIGR01459 family HAD-type hydrolase [Burkholderiaceae bacterium]
MCAGGSAEPPAAGRATRYLRGIGQLARRYDAFVLDQWGVLHDGTTPYPGAINCLEQLHARGKRVVILSNSGKPGEANAEFIAGMGFDRALFEAVVSAGDDARDALRTGRDAFHRKLGSRAFVLARDSDLDLCSWFGVQRADEVEHADFLLVLSIDSPRQSLAGWEPVLRRALGLGLPMLCANPDFARTGAHGTLFEAPGLIARRYAELGGEVGLHGKPDPGIYQACLRRFACARSRVVAIGDSIDHDVLGARNAGLASVLIASGVHRDELGIAAGEPPDAGRCEQLFARAGVTPDYVASLFRW